MKEKPPTRRQLVLLRFLRWHWAEHGKGPSLAELTRAAGAGCRNTAVGYVRRFEGRGWVTRKPGEPRSVRLTRKGARAAEGDSLRHA